MQLNDAQKIAIIGNAGGGKTTLSRRLAQLHNLPLTHVDSIQFVAGLKIRPFAESIALLTEIQNQQTWIIDGYGPLDIIQKRFHLADKIVFIDFPLWRHYWWCTKRQIKSLWQQRAELPSGSREASWAHTVKLYKTLWRVHKQMRPELMRILARDSFRGKVISINTPKQWRQLFREG